VLLDIDIPTVLGIDREATIAAVPLPVVPVVGLVADNGTVPVGRIAAVTILIELGEAIAESTGDTGIESIPPLLILRGGGLVKMRRSN